MSGQAEISAHPHVLVVYGSSTGCARSYAEAISDQLSTHQLSVDVDDANHNPSPAGYDAVVIVGGIYATKWNSAATGWLNSHASLLRQIPVAGAIVCLSVLNPEKRSTSLNYISGALDSAGVRLFSREVFPGWNLSSMLGLTDRTLMKMMRQPEGDFRDFEAARHWADEIASQLVS